MDGTYIQNLFATDEISNNLKINHLGHFCILHISRRFRILLQHYQVYMGLLSPFFRYPSFLHSENSRFKIMAIDYFLSDFLLLFPGKKFQEVKTNPEVSYYGILS